ncbi:MAG TPA: hypothetical protein VM659_09770, partial [Dongiaceae bacterium]|nr:hypothetical protein [Dongiaceae bacterium]
LVAISAFCGTSAKASSILIDEGSLTYDPATKLQWLDLTKTQGLSYNDVLNNVSVDYVKNGWHFATEVDLDKFFRDAGLPLTSYPNGTFSLTSNPSDPGYTAIQHDAYTLGSELGWTLPSGADYYTTGLFDVVAHPSNSAAPGVVTLAVLGYLGDGALGDQVQVNEYLDAARRDDYVRNISSFLVRDVSTVPIPGQAASFGAILLGLAGLNLRRGKQLS